MRYTIRLKISHDYSSAAGSSRHLLRLVPRDIPGRQKLIYSTIDIDPPPAERHPHRDFFGNTGVSVVHDGPHAHLTVSTESQVNVDSPPEGLDMSPGTARLAETLGGVTDLGPGSPLHFLGATPRVPDSAQIADYARDVTGHAQTARSAVLALGQALHADMVFDAASTSVDTPAAEAFAQRRGVCQDFTHIMITGLRAIGIPAGYVSGFLRTEPAPGQPRLDGADAMHAWVRAWCGRDLGWIEHDPTNAINAGLDHIVVGFGRDYDDVAPVTGVLKASGDQVNTQSVDVIPIAGDA